MNPDKDNYHIGAGALYIDGVEVGGTTPEGMVVNYEPEVHMHMSGRFGNTPIKASLIGQTLTLQVTMGETTLANMLEAFAGVTGSSTKVKFGGYAGREISGKRLVLDPFDGTPAWVFQNAVPSSPVEMAYQVENERVYQVTFTALIDPDAATGEELGFVS